MPKEFFLYALFGGHFFCQERFKKHQGICNDMMTEKMVHEYAIKYRNKMGLDVCSEIVRGYLKRKERNITLLCDYAKQLRVYNTLSKYLEIVL